MSEKDSPEPDVPEAPDDAHSRRAESTDRLANASEDKAGSVSRALAKGTFWTTLSEIVEGAVDIGTSIIAARVLAPHDFGTMRIVMLVLTLLEKLSSTGFETALIHKEKDVESYLDVAWTWHVLRGFVIGALLCAAGPIAARIYQQPVLTPLFAACALSMVLRGASNIGTLFFSRQLDFKKMFWVRAARTLLRILVFIPAIFIFKNVWALALSQIGGALAFLVVSFVSHPYRPRVRWDASKLKELIRYGKWITAFAMTGFVMTEGDDLFVSLYFGITALGVYQLAFDISNLPTTKITHVLGSIGMPTYARLQNDPVQLRATFVKITRAVMLLTCPLTVLIWAFVPDLIRHVFGMKWAPVIPIVRILVVSGFIRSVIATGGPLYQAVGRPDLDFKMNLPRFVVLVSVLWPLSAYYGLEGASWAVVFALAATVPPWAISIKSLVNVTIKDFVADNALAMFAAVLLALSFVAVRPRFDESVLGAVAGLLGTLIGWVGSMYVLGRLTRHDLMTEIQRVRAALKRG